LTDSESLTNLLAKCQLRVSHGEFVRSWQLWMALAWSTSANAVCQINSN